MLAKKSSPKNKKSGISSAENFKICSLAADMRCRRVITEPRVKCTHRSHVWVIVSVPEGGLEV
jgi:hypothetical protein